MRSPIVFVLAFLLAGCADVSHALFPGRASESSTKPADGESAASKPTPPPELRLAELELDARSRPEPPLHASFRLAIRNVRGPEDVHIVDRGPDGSEQVFKTKRDAYDLVANLELTTVGMHELVVMAKGKPLRTRKVLMSKLPGIGGPVYRLDLPTSHAFALDMQTPLMPDKGILVRSWHSCDVERPAYRAEWHGPVTVAPIQGRMDLELLRSTLKGRMLGEGRLEHRAAWKMDGVVLQMPEEVRKNPGKWQIVVHFENMPTQTLTLQVGADGAVKGPTRKERNGTYVDLESIASDPDPKVQKELVKIPDDSPAVARSNSPDYPVSAEELRALTRSPELLDLRMQMSKLQGKEHYDSGPRLERKDKESLASWKQRQDASDRSWKQGNANGNRGLYQKQTALWPQMKPLIAKFGGPWTDEEIPYR